MNKKDKRFVKYLIVAAWLMLLFAGLYDAARADGTTTMYVHVSSDTYLNGRHNPQKDSTVEMRLYRGDAVDVITVENGWAEIEGGEAGTAWCCIDYLASYQPGETAPEYTVVSNGRVRVRKEPDGDAARYANNGDTVEVRFVIGGWAYIGNGYIMADYLEVKQE